MNTSTVTKPSSISKWCTPLSSLPSHPQGWSSHLVLHSSKRNYPLPFTNLLSFLWSNSLRIEGLLRIRLIFQEFVKMKVNHFRSTPKDSPLKLTRYEEWTPTYKEVFSLVASISDLFSSLMCDTVRSYAYLISLVEAQISADEAINAHQKQFRQLVGKHKDALNPKEEHGSHNLPPWPSQLRREPWIEKE